MKLNIHFEVSGLNLFVVSTLTVIFFILKITNLISWSWIWVFSPLWIDFLIAICLLIFAVILNFISVEMDNHV